MAPLGFLTVRSELNAWLASVGVRCRLSSISAFKFCMCPVSSCSMSPCPTANTLAELIAFETVALAGSNEMADLFFVAVFGLSTSANASLGSFESSRLEIAAMVDKSPRSWRNVILILNRASIAWLACDKNKESKPKSRKAALSSSIAVPDSVKKIFRNSLAILSFRLSTILFDVAVSSSSACASLLSPVTLTTGRHGSDSCDSTARSFAARSSAARSGSAVRSLDFCGSTQKLFRSNG